MIETISKGAAQSWQMENRYKTMNDGKFDFGFAVEWMRKDLSICIAEARRNGANLPVTALVDQFYAEVEKMGGKRWDTSSLLARLRAVTGGRFEEERRCPSQADERLATLACPARQKRGWRRIIPRSGVHRPTG